jgi:DNA-damage-inducible protein J
MGKTAVIQARVEPKLKNKAAKIIKDLGLNTSQVVNVLFAQIVLNRGLPFALKIPNSLTKKTLMKSKQGKAIKRFSKMKAFIEDLDK